MSKHSPTPWMVSETSGNPPDYCKVWPVEKGHEEVARFFSDIHPGQALANADLAVTCVNACTKAGITNPAALPEVLRLAHRMLELEDAPVDLSPNVAGETLSSWDNAWEAFKAALAAATGEREG